MALMPVRRLVLVAVVSMCSLGAGILLAAPAALAEPCPNAASRQGPSLNLPECRVYEQVTPVNKGDAIDIFGSSGFRPLVGNQAYVAEDGDAVLMQTPASIGPGAPTLQASYVFSRGADGWSMSTPEEPIHQPQQVLVEVLDPADLSRVGFEDHSGVVSDLLGGDPAAYQGTELFGPVGGPYVPLYSLSGLAVRNSEDQVHMTGGSEDLSHVILESQNHSLAPGAEAQDPGSHALYESLGGGECGPTTSNCKLVNVNSEGALVSACGARLGQGEAPYGGAHSAVSSDGSKIFFTAPDPGEGSHGAPLEGPGCSSSENPPELYMREDGERTVEISIPRETLPHEVGTPENPLLPAVFVGASANGSKVFFMTRTQLTKGAVGHAPELYEYNTEPRPEEKTLTLISGNELGTAEGNVDFVGAVSSDGSAVYFSAFGELAHGASPLKRENSLFSPVNLYRYDTLTGTTTFIATLNQDDYPLRMVGEAASWYSSEFEGGSGKGGTEGEGLLYSKEWYTTGNGQYLVFGTIRPLTGYDNNKAPEAKRCINNYLGEEPEQCLELYRYDAKAEENGEKPIVCVSCAGGAPLDGAYFARSAFASPDSGPPRPISENGEDVFFDTANALVPQAVPGKVHVYEWHDGTISMISAPGDPGNAFFLGSSEDGADVFFTTHAQLAPQDTDVSADIYDARVDGGFAGVAPPQCTGTGCQGVPAAPPIFATPASVTFEGVGNFPAPQPPAAVKPKSKVKKCKAGFVKKHAKCVKVKKRAKRSAKGRK
jgi:hypothetical protein